ncbi:hypothetical protein GCM10010832_23130 [Psychroflexus planctonicus]|uniref:DoxX-like family protein n=2 Tax=Psychroflexus planctonicus TaxID=1526575 RepID=A0ABQ1SLC2_9FLAO|nr:hypothetical protein GCM10010832_23130 [Psychroflexus planctonicus]
MEENNIMDFENIDYIQLAAQLIVAVTLLNVWLLRFNKSTQWRGGNASSMKEEFKAYGLPNFMMYLVGGLKVLFGLGLIVGIAYPVTINISAIGIVVLMLGAIGMHIKVKDAPKKSFPAFTMLVISLLILVLNN